MFAYTCNYFLMINTRNAIAESKDKPTWRLLTQISIPLPRKVMLLYNLTHSGDDLASHMFLLPPPTLVSCVYGFWCFCQISQSRQLRQKWGWANLGSDHSSKINERSKGRLLGTTAAFRDKGVGERKEGGFDLSQPLLLIENYWLPPVHQSASRGWTLNHSKGMNELISSREHPCWAQASVLTPPSHL